METLLEPQLNSALLPKMTAADLENLQLECAEIAAHGGELGPIAAEIARISRELRAISSEIDDFLAS